MEEDSFFEGIINSYNEIKNMKFVFILSILISNDLQIHRTTMQQFKMIQSMKIIPHDNKQITRIFSMKKRYLLFQLS